MKKLIILSIISSFCISTASAWTCTQKCPSGNVFSGLTNGKYECLKYQKSAKCHMEKEIRENNKRVKILKQQRRSEEVAQKSAKLEREKIERRTRQAEIKQRQAELEIRRKEFKLERERQAERQDRLDEYNHQKELRRQENKQRKHEQNMDIAKELGGILGGFFAK